MNVELTEEQKIKIMNSSDVYIIKNNCRSNASPILPPTNYTTYLYPIPFVLQLHRERK
jgi:hypothetical protein